MSYHCKKNLISNVCYFSYFPFRHWTNQPLKINLIILGCQRSHDDTQQHNIEENSKLKQYISRSSTIKNVCSHMQVWWFIENCCNINEKFWPVFDSHQSLRHHFLQKDLKGKSFDSDKIRKLPKDNRSKWHLLLTKIFYVLNKWDWNITLKYIVSSRVEKF